MRIAQINTLDNIGGAAKTAYRLHNQFKKKGHYSYLLVGRKSIQDDLLIREIKPKKENKIKRVISDRLGMDGFLKYKDRIFKNQMIKKSEIINLHNLHGNFFNLNDLIKLSEMKPLVWTLHDMWAFTGHCAHAFDCQKWQDGCGRCPYLDTYPSLRCDLTWFLRRWKKRIYEESDFVIVVPSQWLLKKLKKSILKNKRAELIYNGVDEKIFRPQDKRILRKKLGLPLDKKIICFAAQGGLSNRWKGSAYLKKILKEMRQKKSKALFLEIGTGADDLGDFNHIKVPYIKEEKILSQYYAASDLFLFSSLAENCPLVVLEAMACGLPTISFDVGGVKELVVHRKSGYIAKYKDEKDLLKGVNLFLTKNKLREKNGIEARKRIERYFTLEMQAKKYLKLYQEIINE